jgi:hypothetical protein
MSINHRDWLTVMLIGDPRVGKLSIPWLYGHVYGGVPPSPTGGMWNQHTVDCNIRLLLNSSPIQPKERRAKHQERPGKAASRVAKKMSGPGSKMVEMRINFWRVKGFNLEGPMTLGMSRMWNIVDAVVICYDCSRPDTFHNAIYKVLKSLPALSSGYGS